MADVVIHGDFDRDGRLAATARERAQRLTAPGAIVVANVDRDGRALPTSALPGPAVAIDAAAVTKSGADDDLLPIEIHVSAAHPAATTLSLEIDGDNVALVQLSDSRRRMVTPLAGPGGSRTVPLPGTAGRHRFFLEATTVPGSPAAQPHGQLRLRVVGTQAGARTVVDEAVLTLAPMILIGDLATCERLYMVELDTNVPSVRDVEQALTAARPPVPLVKIPPPVSMGDTWIQDQFQLGMISAPHGTQRVVLHLPRLRSDSHVTAQTANLSTFVRSHFPSTDLGLIDDFWHRSLIVNHVGGPTRVAFTDTQHILKVFRKVTVVEEFLREVLDHLCRALPDTFRPCKDVPRPSGLLAFRLQGIPELLRRLLEVVRERKRGVGQAERDRLDEVARTARSLVSELNQVIRVIGADLFHIVSQPLTVDIFGGDLVQLEADVGRLHDALVYGGNVEVSPPEPAAPFGRTVIGEGEDRMLDPDVRAFFDAADPIQPVVTIDTGWLAVGHVDEVIGFLPDRTQRDRHVVLRASPAVAASLFDRAGDLYHAGLPIHHPDKGGPWRPLTLSRHHMRDGAHPVTRMFRGKHWRHFHPPDPTDVSNPPAIYLRIVRWYSGLLNETNAPFVAEPNEQADHYPAALTMWDWEFFEGGTAARVETEKLAGIDQVLQDAFPWEIVAVPVVFDRTLDLSAQVTSAFTPNLVNFQFANGVLLIPNPFGPRMQVDDALAVVATELRARGQQAAAGRLSRSYVTRQGLTRPLVWLNGALGVGGHRFDTLQRVAAEFRDGFPGKTVDEVAEAIRRANRRDFDASGDLRDGWRRILIPETTVDPVQLYTHAILDGLGITVRWVDSWAYHVNHGEIHCGTNALRALARPLPRWWATRPPSAATSLD